MGQELLDVGMGNGQWTYYQRRPRLYYKATNSKGYQVTRGSASKQYAYCAVASDFNRWGGLWSSWASTEALATKYAKQMSKNNHSIKFEVVKVEVSSAKEHRLIKKQMSLTFLAQLTEGKNTTTETEQVNA